MAARHAAVVLAGGKARRMGGVPKFELMISGRSLLSRVLDAVPNASPRVVVGDVFARGFVVTAEDHPDAGPVHAAIAGLHPVPAAVPLVAILAADLPFLTQDVITALTTAIRPGVDGAVLVDHAGRRQWLCGVWRQEILRTLAGTVTPGMGMRQVLGHLRVAEVTHWDGDLPPWFDCDTPAALDYARRLDREFRRARPREADLQTD